jgi:spore maturation protein CgeB
MPVPDKMQIAYFVHSLRSDWNNGNAHFLRGLIRELDTLGHEVVVFEPRTEWSIENLLDEPQGDSALVQFHRTYPDIRIQHYDSEEITNHDVWRTALSGFDIVVVHEWNPAALTHALLELRYELGYKALFHDTHHRASSSPGQIRMLAVDRFDGVIAFGEALRAVYQSRFDMRRVWTLHEAADTKVFQPAAGVPKCQDVIWIGNWGDDERSEEIREFLLRPAALMSGRCFAIFGVRYPEDALKALHSAGVRYGGYLPNLQAPCVYASSRITVHVPRQQYVQSMTGIPTIRVFEALACGIPLISAPWNDTERLFREGDFTFVSTGEEMRRAIEHMLEEPTEAQAQAVRGRETVLARHTCAHRAVELEEICREVLA